MTALTVPALEHSPRARAARAASALLHLPPELEAPAPPEYRGMTRDAVRMLVATKHDGALVHSHFSELPRFLDEGDLVVINTSGTLAAEVDGTAARRQPRSRSTSRPSSRPGSGRSRSAATAQAYLGPTPGDVIDSARRRARRAARPLLPRARRRRRAPVGLAARDARARCTATWPATAGPSATATCGAAIRSRAYQNVYATEPGSAEMPSAGRPFTPEVLTRLVAKGVGVAPLLLHTGVASLEANEPPYAEYFRVSLATAHRINDTRRAGGRVIAIGTTVVRALESVVDEHGHVHPSEGWTETVVSPEQPVRSIDGFLTGWHEPEASHLAMLEAIAGRPLLEASYAAALAEGYLWHEFGDVHLILP